METKALEQKNLEEKIEICGCCGKEMTPDKVFKKDAYNVPYCYFKCYYEEDEYR
jgi:hypothetical protein